MRGLAGLVAVAVAGALAANASGAAASPKLTLLDRSPVVVAGSGFASGTRIVVTVRAPSQTVTRSLDVGPGGGFRLRVARLTLSGALRCAGGVTISARIRDGAVVLWRAPRLPDCAAPLPVAP
jgi:hypothetical protein